MSGSIPCRCEKGQTVPCVAAAICCIPGSGS
jgi:methyl coenzyme M reductase beta subunit